MFSAASGAKVKFNVALFPAPITVFGAIPLADTSEALTVTDETVTLEFPVFVIVADLFAVLPAFTLPKFTLVGLAVIVDVAPVPEAVNATPVGEFGALLRIETVPFTFPAASGEN